MNIPQGNLIQGDDIKNLPTDTNMPSHDEIQLINTYFRENKESSKYILEESKEIIIIAILFVILSVPQVDDLIKKFLPVASSPYILLIIKGIMLGVIFYIIKNFYLIKAK